MTRVSATEAAARLKDYLKVKPWWIDVTVGILGHIVVTVDKSKAGADARDVDNELPRVWFGHQVRCANQMTKQRRPR